MANMSGHESMAPSVHWLLFGFRTLHQGDVVLAVANIWDTAYFVWLSPFL